VTLFNNIQFLNKLSFINLKLTLVGNVKLDNAEHPSNALPPIKVTPFGIVMEGKSEQSLNAEPPIETADEIETDVKFEHCSNVLWLIVVTEVEIDGKFAHPKKAIIPIDVTLFGIATVLEILEQFLNVSSPIFLRIEFVVPNVIDGIDEHP
jgi:hypothetical protein